MTDPIIIVVEGALRILGCETREVAEALIDAAAVELTGRERAVILDRFTSATEYERDNPGAGESSAPHVGYSLGGRRWLNLNRPT